MVGGNQADQEEVTHNHPWADAGPHAEPKSKPVKFDKHSGCIGGGAPGSLHLADWPVEIIKVLLSPLEGIDCTYIVLLIFIKLDFYRI